MVVAVVAVWVVQPAVDEVVRVIAVRHRLMPAPGPMGVSVVAHGHVLVTGMDLVFGSHGFDTTARVQQA
jgi:hypothetical protein